MQNRKGGSQSNKTESENQSENRKPKTEVEQRQDAIAGTQKDFQWGHLNDTQGQAMQAHKHEIEKNLDTKIKSWLSRNEAAQKEIGPALVALQEGAQILGQIVVLAHLEGVPHVSQDVLNNVAKHQNAATLPAVENLKLAQANEALSDMRKGLETWKNNRGSVSSNAVDNASQQSTPKMGK